MSRGTRTRAATHGSGLVTGAKCPACACHHVVEHVLRGLVKRLCGACGHVWEPTLEERAAS